LAFTTTTGAGGTSLIGTSGVDTLSLSGNSFPLFIGAQAANDVIVFGTATTYSSVQAELGQGADNFTSTLGTVSSSTISGNDGNDVIALGAVSGSSALINGNAGADSITVGGALTSGARVLGGADNDTITVTAAVSSGSIVNGNKGNDTITVSASTSSSTIFGGEGNDTLNAGASNVAVSLSGDAGNDTITGGQALIATPTAGDSLYGGSGNDTINASLTIDEAADTLTGGNGVDTFGALGNTNATSSAFVAGPDITVGATLLGADVITDFTAGSGGDIIDLNGTGAFTYGGAVGGSTTNLTAASWYAFSGTWSSGTFTVAASGQGTDTLIARVAAAATAFDVTSDAVVLRGIANTQIVTANLG